MKKTQLTLLALASLGMTLGISGCGNNSSSEAPHVHEMEFHGEVASTCHTQGHDAYNVCTSCGKMFDLDGAEITEIPLLDLDPNEHEGTKSLVLDAGYTASYEVGDTFDLDGATFRWKCELCEGVPLVATAKSAMTVTYPTEGATCFTAEDAKKDSVTVTFTSTTYTVSATVSVSRKENAIIGFDDMSGTCGYQITNFDNLSLVSARSGETVKYAFKGPNDTDFVSREDFADDYYFINTNSDNTPTVYEVRASVEGNDEYGAAEDTKTLTIYHNDAVWDTSRDDYDFLGCMCTPDDVTKFVKTTEGTQEITLSDETATLSMAGSSYNSETDTIKSVKIVDGENEIDLGTGLEISLAAVKEAGLSGEQTIEVVVTTPENGVRVPECDHTVRVNVLFVTATIATADEWKTNVIPATSGTTITGYFKVTADLSLSYAPAWMSGWDKAIFSGTIDGCGHKITLGQGTYGQFYFAKDATIKNMTLHNNWWRRTTVNYALLANKSVGTTYENLTFDIPVMGSGATDEYEPATNYGYLFGNGGAQANSFKDCSWDFGTYQLPCLLSHSANSTETNTFENCALNCKDYTELYYCNNGVVMEAEGLTITTNVTVPLDITPIEIDSAAESASVKLPDTYADYSVEDIYFTVSGGNTSVGTDLTNVVLPDAIKSDVQMHGAQTLYVKVANGSKKATLEVPVIIVTSTVTTNDELLAIVNPSAVTTTYGYYKLGNDLNINSNWTEKTSSTISVFAGTFDGCGHTITSKSRTGGVFGDLNGAAIKNLTINDGWCYGGVDMAQVLLSRDMKTSVITDCTFKVTAKATRTLNTSLAISAQNYGWINCRVCMDNSFTNCTFDAGTVATPIQTLLGTHSSCVRNTFVNSTFSCDSYYCLYQSAYTNLVTTTADGLTITGTCVYTAE